MLKLPQEVHLPSLCLTSGHFQYVLKGHGNEQTPAQILPFLKGLIDHGKYFIPLENERSPNWVKGPLTFVKLLCFPFMEGSFIVFICRKFSYFAVCLQLGFCGCIFVLIQINSTLLYILVPPLLISFMCDGMLFAISLADSH